MTVIELSRILEDERARVPVLICDDDGEQVARPIGRVAYVSELNAVVIFTEGGS